MPATPILDDFSPDSAPLRRLKIQRIFIGIELGLWALCGIGYLLKTAGASFYHYLLLPAFSLLGLFYLLCPIWLFGSVGWRRHVGSHLIGIALFGSFLPILFVVEHWPNAAEQTRNGLKLGIVATLATLAFYFLRKDSPHGGQFFLAALIRTMLAMVFMLALVR